MIAIFAEKPGGPEVLKPRSIPVPEPKEGEVLIRVHAAGINRPDIGQRRGAYPPPPGVSEALGLEISGEVVAVGPGADSQFSVGDEVCSLVAGGGYAEYCVAPIQQVLPKPKGLSHIESAALPETFFTVWTNVFRIGRFKEGETVLIHGGASGIGTTATQLVKAFGATQIIVTAGTDEKGKACLDLGADHAINYRNEDFADRVLEITDGRGVDVILDLVCAKYLESNLKALAVDGRLVIIAFLGGGQADGINIEGMIRKRQTLSGSTLRPQTPEMKGAIADDLRSMVWPKIEEGSIKPVIQSIHKLENAADGHAELEAGNHFGKIVLEVDQNG